MGRGVALFLRNDLELNGILNVFKSSVMALYWLAHKHWETLAAGGSTPFWSTRLKYENLFCPLTGFAYIWKVRNDQNNEYYFVYINYYLFQSK